MCNGLGKLYLYYDSFPVIPIICNNMVNIVAFIKHYIANYTSIWYRPKWDIALVQTIVHSNLFMQNKVLKYVANYRKAV